MAASLCAASALAQDRDEARDLEEMLARVNEMRSATGLRPLMRDPRLDRAALTQSEDMADHDMLAHVSPRSGDPAARVAAQGVAVTQLSENISVNTDVLTAHDAFVASEGHRANLLNGAFNRIGLAAAHGSRGVYVTQIFANVNDGASDSGAAQAAQMPAPSAMQATAQAQATVTQSATQPVVRVPANGTRRVAGYWVQSQGRWWYYPLPADARPGQILTPSSTQPAMSQPAMTVQPAPYTYVAPAAPVYTQQQTYIYNAQPTYYAPQQQYYAPQTQYYAPQPGYYAPGSVYVPRPVYVAPQQIYVGPQPAFGWSPRRHYSRWR
ncbi:MAG: hypothetical protein IPK60_04725 [Sandaracinaceae bacterium]|nr:hypothetical protein [Sandaracinaceae bacterium]